MHHCRHRRYSVFGPELLVPLQIDITPERVLTISGEHKPYVHDLCKAGM